MVLVCCCSHHLVWNVFVYTYVGVCVSLTLARVCSCTRVCESCVCVCVCVILLLTVQCVMSVAPVVDCNLSSPGFFFGIFSFGPTPRTQLTYTFTQPPNISLTPEFGTGNISAFRLPLPHTHTLLSTHTSASNPIYMYAHALWMRK